MREDLQWYAVVTVALTAILLALWAFLAHPELRGGADFVGVINLVFRFVSFRYFPPENVEIPLQLSVARYLWVVVFAFGSLKGIYIALRKDLKISLARYARGHVVIVGLGETAVRVAINLRRAGKSVVIAAGQPDRDVVSRLQRQGAVVILGEPTDPELLKAAGVGRASAIVACDAEVELNLAALGATYDLLPPRAAGANRPTAMVEISDPQLQREIARDELWLPDRSRLRIVPFSIETLAVALHLQALGLGKSAEAASGVSGRYVVLGDGLIAEALIFGLIDRVDADGGHRPELLLLGPDATRIASRLEQALGSAAIDGMLAARDVSLDTVDSATVPPEVAGDPAATAGIFVCTTSTQANLSLGVRLRDLIQSSGNPVPPLHLYIDMHALAESSYRPSLAPDIHLWGSWMPLFQQYADERGDDGSSVGRAR